MITTFIRSDKPLIIFVLLQRHNQKRSIFIHHIIHISNTINNVIFNTAGLSFPSVLVQLPTSFYHANSLPIDTHNTYMYKGSRTFVNTFSFLYTKIILKHRIFGTTYLKKKHTKINIIKRPSSNRSLFSVLRDISLA